MKKFCVGLFILAGFTAAARAQTASGAAAPDNQYSAVLFKACQDGDLSQVTVLLNQGVPINGQTGPYGFTPLIGATGHLDVLNYLISQHADIDFPDHEGSTALLHACSEDHADTALALIAAGAHVNFDSGGARTPLMYAAAKGDDPIVTALIAHKAKLDANCSAGPPVLWAVIGDHLSTVKLLATAGANLSLLPVGGTKHAYMALESAAANGDLDMIDYLLGRGMDVNGVDASGSTPLIAAADWARPEAIDHLLDKGAKIDLQTANGNTALLMAKTGAVTNVLLQHHPNVELKNKSGMTALIMAAWTQNLEQVTALVDHGADINATDNEGETALTRAGDMGEVSIVELLKNKGATRTDLHVIAKADPPQPLPPAHAWALLVGLMYTQRDGADPKILGGGYTLASRKLVLKRDWNISDKESLLKELDDLHDRGHHKSYQDEGATLAVMLDEQFAQFLALHPGKTTEFTALRASYLKWKNRSGLAWDLCRAGNIVNDGFAAHYLSEQEAWDQLMTLARQTQASFSSWQEMSDNFLDGREIWANQRDPRFEACANLLLNPKDPNSPWNQNAWNTDLSAAGN